MIVSSFYKYVSLSRVSDLRKSMQQKCDSINLKGKILLALEGINGSVSGSSANIREFHKYLNEMPKFTDITFKNTQAKTSPYKRMIVRLRPEIVTFGRDVDLKNTAKHVSSTKLNSWIENNSTDILLLDARNNYESRIGSFANAVTPSIDNFRDFKNALKDLANLKNKKIVMYCTGGVRCEKASAYLIEHGFTDVYQLKDGVLGYIEKYPDSHFKGRCFVFDQRLSIPSGVKNQAISACDLCHAKCDTYINCKNVKCDKFFISCESCSRTFKNTCSKRCKNVVAKLS